MVSPGFEQGEHGGGVGLRAGVRLHVGGLRAEQGLDPVDGQLLDDVDVLAAAVVAPAGVALGVLVGQDRALGLHDRGGGEVLRRDHFEGGLLAAQLMINGPRDLSVNARKGLIQGARHGGLFRFKETD